MRGRTPRHARPSGRGALAAAYDDLRAELVAARSAHWTDQLELLRLTALTEELTGQVGSLQEELASVRAALEVSRATPPLVIREPYPVYPAAAQPFVPPAYAPQPYAAQPYPAPPVAAPAPEPAPGPAPVAAAAVREDLLLAEMAELRRLVAHQQQLLADLTVRLLDLLARFIPVAPAPPAYAAPPQPQPYPAPQPGQPAAPQPPAAAYTPPATLYQAPDDLVMDDETASRLRVIREAFGR